MYVFIALFIASLTILFVIFLIFFFFFFIFFFFFFFFFQAEDGIRDHCVTGVQTCALPISRGSAARPRLLRAQYPEDGRPREGRRQEAPPPRQDAQVPGDRAAPGGGRRRRRLRGQGQIGRASCRERA